MSISGKNVFGPLPSTTRGKSCFLSAHPNNGKFAYCAGNNVIIRDLENPLQVDFYLEHAKPPTVAQYAPSGNYMCSGDSSGMVRVWDTINETHILKLELAICAGEVRDIAWTGDSQRIVAVGDGRDTYGKAFSWNAGNSVGTISHHEKRINTCAAKPSRPMRVVTGADDFFINWYEGPPFKYKRHIQEHERFVNCVRYSPDGEVFASAGSDKKIFVFDGKTGEKKSVLEGHTLGVYCLSWSADSKQFLTASADRSLRIWDAETSQCITTFQLEKTTENQQLGCLWAGNNLLGVGLDGKIRYLDPANPDQPRRVLTGHQVYTTAVGYHAESQSVFSASYDGKVTRWNEGTGESVWIGGKGHTNTIPHMLVAAGNVVTGSMDDSIRFTPVGSDTFTESSVSVDSPVQGLSASVDGGTVAAVSMKTAYVLKDQKVVAETPIANMAKSVAINPEGSVVAVGSERDKTVHFFDVSGSSLAPADKIEGFRGAVVALAYSPDGSLLATGDTDRYVRVYKVATKEKLFESRAHTARISAVAFSPDSTRIASCSQDSNLKVFGVDGTAKGSQATHRLGATNLTWMDNNTVATVGQDCAVKTWNV
eukprot:TRINITY_DN462_c0_g1_i1.p2 TRINITY_DN462_c0_g1~~TRINITY_DN462_c0_g1_i1.p2  ORF type:complete len:595 (+),score=231.87 TRINITY_DN462_c0_g1_i1:67-1851(+)